MLNDIIVFVITIHDINAKVNYMYFYCHDVCDMLKRNSKFMKNFVRYRDLQF